MDLKQKLAGVIRVKANSVKPFAGAKESKTVNLSIDYSDCTVEDILEKAIRTDVISWQNGPGRKNYAQFQDGATVKISAKAPGRSPQVDPETAIKARLAAMSTKADREAYVKQLLAEAESKVR